LQYNITIGSGTSSKAHWVFTTPIQSEYGRGKDPVKTCCGRVTPRSHRAATQVCRSSHDLKKYYIGTNRRFGKSWSSLRPYYDAPTSNAFTTMLRRSLPTGGRIYCVYTKLSLRHSRSYNDATQT
jgi:hypothetical protein